MGGMDGEFFGWFRLALETEDKGIAFYGRCLEGVKNKDAGVLFRFLMDQESGHKETLGKIFDELSQGDANRVEDSLEFLKKLGLQNPLFSESEIKGVGDSPVSEMLNKAMDYEKLGIRFYSDLAKKAGNIYVRRLFQELSRQEGKHLEEIRKFGLGMLGGR